MAKLFPMREPTAALRSGQVERLMQTYPDAFADRGEAVGFLRSIHLPFSRSWAFKSNPKCGTSSTKRVLFFLEFGVPLTVHLKTDNDINPEKVVHDLSEAHVFRTAYQTPNGFRQARKALRLTTVRNPLTRARSAFLYLCWSDELQHQWFSKERLRMNALVGFDWDNDPGTETGMLKFLDFIEQCSETQGAHTLNVHWRPQALAAKDDVFAPDLIGRAEALPDFYQEIAERLDRPLPPDMSRTHTNAGTAAHDVDLLTPAVRRRVREIYSRNFEIYGYEP